MWSVCAWCWLSWVVAGCVRGVCGGGAPVVSMVVNRGVVVINVSRIMISISENPNGKNQVFNSIYANDQETIMIAHNRLNAHSLIMCSQKGSFYHDYTWSNG